MNEQNFNTSEQPEQFDLEQRLTAYYGPQLREQPLSQASWQYLVLQLASQEGTRRRRRFHWHLPQRRSQTYVPAPIQEALVRITYEARVPLVPSMLHYRLKPHISEPAVHGSWSGKRKFRLLLPSNAATSMGQAELDVLLATGLARSIVTRKLKYTFGRLLLASVLLIACLTFTLFWMHHIPFVGFLAAMPLCAGIIWLSHIQARSLAFHADTLIVQWLGRNRICSGLHALADRSQAPGRRRWSEPSLAERIERVCGTRVETRSNQLTLVG